LLLKYPRTNCGQNTKQGHQKYPMIVEKFANEYAEAALRMEMSQASCHFITRKKILSGTMEESSMVEHVYPRIPEN
jgi:proline dehydrogenase